MFVKIEKYIFFSPIHRPYGNYFPHIIIMPKWTFVFFVSISIFRSVLVLLICAVPPDYANPMKHNPKKRQRKNNQFCNMFLHFFVLIGVLCITLFIYISMSYDYSSAEKNIKITCRMHNKRGEMALSDTY